MSKKKKKNMSTEETPKAEQQVDEQQAQEAAQETQQESQETPQPEQQQVDDKENRIESLGQKCIQLNEQYLRLSAEFDNYRRRTAKEKLDLVSTASEEVIKGLLPILDDFQRAVVALKDTDDSDSAKEGTELIFNKMMAYLKSRGLEAIDAVGKDFDTDFHEAVAQFPAPSPEQKNKVIDIAQQGYTLNGKVIRYAKVVIGI